MKLRKKRLPSRRRRALRWLAALVLLAGLCHWTGIYPLTPDRALRRQERYFAAGRTEADVVLRDPYLQESGVGLVTASRNETAVMLGLRRWSLLSGWQQGFAWTVGRGGGTVDTVAGYYSWDPEESFYPYVVYGCVNDPRVTAVKLTVREQTLEGDFLREYELEPEICTADDGQRYFLETFEAGGLCAISYRTYGEGAEAAGDIPFMSLIYDWPDI